MDDLQVFAALRPVEPPLSNHERSAMRTQLFTTSSADAADVDHGLAEVLPFGDHRRPPAVMPTSSTGERRPRWLGIAAAAVAAVGLGGLWVGVANRDLQEPAAGLPAGFNEGLYGTQIVLTEVPDGDADTETFVLRTEPDVGTVTATVTTGAVVVPTTAVGSAAADPVVPSPPVLCIETTGGGSACMPRELLGTPSFLLDARRANGQVVVFALPSSAVAVTFAAGTERYWSEPLHGMATFPFLESAAPNVTFAAVDRDGRVVWRDAAADSTLTRAEVVAATITEQTNDVLANGWFGDVGQNGYGPELIRLHGRTTLTGFQGPFAVQEYAFGTGGSIRTWVSAITVSAVDIVAVRARLEPLANGSVRTQPFAQRWLRVLRKPCTSSSLCVASLAVCTTFPRA